MQEASRTPGRGQTVATVIIATVLVGWVLHAGRAIIQPIVIALLLANVLQPVVRAFERRKIPGPVAVVFLSIILVWAIFQVTLLVQANVANLLGQPPPAVERSLQSTAPPTDAGPAAGAAGDAASADAGSGGAAEAAAAGEAGAEEVAAAGEEATHEAGDGEVDGSGELSDGEVAVDEDGNLLEQVKPDPAWTRIANNLKARVDDQQYMSEDVKETIRDAIDSFDVQGAMASLIGGGIDFSRTLVIILIYMAFIFAEQNIFKRKIMAIAGKRSAEASAALDTMSRGVQRYLSVKTLISLLTGLLCYFLLILTQVPYAAIFALLTFLLNYIPTFGSIIAGILAALTALAVHDSVAPAVIVAIGYMTVNTVLGSIIEPRILGRELNISPLVIIISVVVWVGLWGVVGGFLAVPLTAAIQIILASSERSRPIAILLSGAPPSDDEQKRARRVPRLTLPRRRKSSS